MEKLEGDMVLAGSERGSWFGFVERNKDGLEVGER